MPSIKEKLDKMINSPSKKLYHNKDFKQNSEERKAQISFYKLLMILAYSDDSVDESELDLIKNHFYEDCLTESEWMEIDFYKIHKPGKDEIKQILENALLKVESIREKAEFQKALAELVNADGVLKSEEKDILSFINNEIDTASVEGFKNIFNKIVNNIKSERKEEVLSKEFVKNPIYPFLKNIMPDENQENLSVISARLGLALIVIHSDMNFHEKEKILFKQMLKKECNLNDELINDLLTKIYKIPEEYFEIIYLCRILTDNLSEEERINVMKDLFKIARADKIYDPYEAKYLKIIAGSLFISDKIFLKLKSNSI